MLPPTGCSHFSPFPWMSVPQHHPKSSLFPAELFGWGDPKASIFEGMTSSIFGALVEKTGNLTDL